MQLGESKEVTAARFGPYALVAQGKMVGTDPTSKESFIVEYSIQNTRFTVLDKDIFVPSSISELVERGERGLKEMGVFGR